MSFLVMVLLRIVVFAIAIAFITRRTSKVRVEPRAALPVVALVFAVLNTALYGLIGFAVKVVSLWTLAIFAPFLANMALLWITDRILKPLKIDGLMALLHASVIITIAHVLLRLVERFVF